jgi:hypothetical protein
VGGEVQAVESKSISSQDAQVPVLTCVKCDNPLLQNW